MIRSHFLIYVCCSHLPEKKKKLKKENTLKQTSPQHLLNYLETLLGLLVSNLDSFFSWSNNQKKKNIWGLDRQALAFSPCSSSAIKWPQITPSWHINHQSIVNHDLYSNTTARGLCNLAWKGRSPRPGISESVPGEFKGHINLFALQSHSPLPSTQTSEMLLLRYVVLYLHIHIMKIFWKQRNHLHLGKSITLQMTLQVKHHPNYSEVWPFSPCCEESILRL